MTPKAKIAILEENIKEMQKVIADLIKVVGDMNDGSEYYTKFDDFKTLTREFKYEHFEYEK